MERWHTSKQEKDYYNFQLGYQAGFLAVQTFIDRKDGSYSPSDTESDVSQEESNLVSSSSEEEKEVLPKRKKRKISK